MTEPKRVQTYSGDEVDVTYDPNVCIHAAECVQCLPSVFRPRERRWVQLEHASAAAVMDAVAKCPSGALQVTRKTSG